MTEEGYVFDDASAAAELYRVQLIESVFDERTRALLRSSGSLGGLQCLEVGAGAGSVAAWLHSEVGPDGSVTAVDINVRFLDWLKPRVHVVEGDFAALDIPAESFDVVHARYVLIHNRDASAVLDAMLRALRPGGVLVLEEPDFSAAQAFACAPDLRSGFEHVKRAIQGLFDTRGMDYAFGRALPALVGDRVPCITSIEYDCSVQPGGSRLAEMMRLSTLALSEKYIATGYAQAGDIVAYSALAQAPDCWATYYATVRVVARKLAHAVG